MNRSGYPADEWAQRQSQSQQIPQPAPVSRTSINPGSTPMARPPAQQQSNSVPANSTTSGSVGSRASSFFSSFRKSSADTMERGGVPTQAGANSYQGHAQTMGNPQRRPDAGWDEYGRPLSMVLANDTQRPQPQQSQTQGRTGRLVSPRMQSMQQSQSYSSVSSRSPPQTVGRRKSSLLKTIPVMDQGRVNSEIQSVVDLSVAHSNKVYSSGPLVRRIEKNADGSINSDARWVEVWAQLGGTTLSVWEMDAIKQASDEGRQVPPTYINVTDSLVQVLGSVIRAASFYGPEERRSNVITINTAGSNLILFACPSPQTLLSWATALRLAAWEKSRIEEIYTGHLFRLSMMEDGKFHEPESTLQKGKLEGWAKVRISGSTEWQRLWVVVSTSFLTSSIDSGRPASPSGSTKKNRLSSFLGGGKSSQSANGHGSLAAAGVPAIAMYPGNKPKDKKKVLFTTTKITQAFAVYPERPEVISQSALFKIEGTIKDERVYSSTNSRERSAEPREGYALIIPEVESGKQGSNEMIKWLIAVHDAFGLYGRPEGYSWNPRDPHSVFFTYPFGPYRDHLFLDRELAEIIDPSVHETSRVRALLTDILIRRMHGPATAPQQSDAAGRPQLPPLGFGEGGRPSSADRSALATIKEQSVTSADSHLNGATQKAALNTEAQRPVPSQSIPGNPQSPTDLPYGRTPTSSTTEQHSPSPSSAKATFGPPLIPPLSTLPKSSDIGSESPRKPGTPSIASNNTPGPQSPPKLSFDVNQRSESPLSARNGVVARNEAGTNYSDVPNHQHIPSIPSLRTPSGNTTNPIENPRVEQPAQPAQTVQPVASSSSSQIAGSWAAPAGPPPPSAQVVPVDQNQPATPAVPSAAPSPAPVPEQSDPQLFEQEGALYLLSQMDDEPPETSPLREASSLPLPPRLAALERQRANSADEDIPPSPFATMSNAPSPFTSTGSVAARYNSQSPDVNSYANSIRPQGNGPWTSAIGNTSPGLSQTNPQISSSSSPRPSESVNMMQPTNRQHSLNMPITHSPLPMSTKSTEEQEDENHHADALAAFNFINSGSLCTAVPVDERKRQRKGTTGSPLLLRSYSKID
ncbi:hypothetical protein FS842_009468 [Serendipita sp. 407]|nr:hypothetical protein FS842_009468 [Serendipita sp. 407]